MDAGATHQSGLLSTGRFAELEDALVERVAELRAGRPLAPLTVVVGSAALRTRLGDVLVRRLGAVANVSIVTLARLATDVVAAAERRPPRLAGVLVRERLVRLLVDERRRTHGLRYFGPVGERPHFARALLGCFDDLRQARVEPRAGWARTRTPGKAADLEALYAAYCDGLAARGLMDEAALLLAAAAAMGACEAPAPARATTILYGLYDLNVAQEALVAALLDAGADLFLPAPRAGGTESAPAMRVALSAGREARRLPAPAPVDDLGRTAVALGVAEAAAGLDLQGDGRLVVVSVADERREVQEAVREVLRSVGAGERPQDGGAAAWDCAVVVPHAAEAERFAAGLAAAGLPVACRRPGGGPAARVVLRLLDCLAPAAGKPCARRAVLDLLAASAATEAQLDAGCGAEAAGGTHREPADSAGTVPAAAVTALWADEARRAGVVAGLEEWVERMGRRRYGLERRLEEARQAGGVEEADDDALEPVARLEARLAAAQSLEAAVARLARACARLPERASWSRWADALAELAAVAWPAGLAAAAADLLTRLQALAVVGEEVGVLEMAAVLRELAADRVPEGRVGRDGVAVLTALELRGLRFHTVVFTGLAEGGFPARGRPDPILGDAERRDIARALGVRLPLAEERDAEAALLFALAVEAARERLALLAPRADAATGRPRLPSRALLRLASLSAGRAVGLEEFLSGAPLEAVWRRVAGRAAGEAIWVDARERDVAVLLGAGGAAAVACEYLGAVFDAAASDGAAPDAVATGVSAPEGAAARESTGGAPHGAEAARRRLEQWRSGRVERCGVYDGLLGEAARAALVARDPFAAELHPTGLERYIDCPFVYLLRDVLGLSVPEEPEEGLEIEPLEFGSLAHEILRRAYAEQIAGGLDRDGTRAALVRAWEAGCAEAKRRGVTGAELAWRARSRMLLDDLLESVERDAVFAQGDGRPSRVEWSFGEAHGLPVSLELPGGRRVRFAGRVDRVDETPRGARVIDYKTGSGVSETDRLKARLSVQLPVYALAVRAAAAEGASCEHVECRYQMVTRRGGFASVPLELGDEEREANLARLASAALCLIEAGVFARAARGRCDYCDVKYACGTSAWARGRKRRDAALAALVALQGGELDETGAEQGAAATTADALRSAADG